MENELRFCLLYCHDAFTCNLVGCSFGVKVKWIHLLKEHVSTTISMSLYILLTEIKCVLAQWKCIFYILINGIVYFYKKMVVSTDFRAWCSHKGFFICERGSSMVSNMYPQAKRTWLRISKSYISSPFFSFCADLIRDLDHWYDANREYCDALHRS